MNSAVHVYLVLLVLGLLLLGAEIYLPGGILGIVGAGCLIGAVVVGFKAFGAQWGFLSLFGVVLLTGVGIAFWIRFFPKTGIGKRLELKKNGRDFKSHPDYRALAGKTGLAASVLRPAGIALIDGHRVDVITDGEWIEKDTPIVVTRVEGLRVEVRRAQPANPPEGSHA